MESRDSNAGMSKQEGNGPNQLRLEACRHVRELLEVAGIFLAVLVVLHLSIQNFRIDGMSMYPMFANEQHIVVSKLSYLSINIEALMYPVPYRDKPENTPTLFVSKPPSYGDVIAFTYPVDTSKGFVKRVIGLPGDIIELDKGQVIRNGEALDEPYVVNNDGRSIEPVTVPEGTYYVLGDNRPISNDSRNWGFVAEEFIIGRAWFSYWPSDRIEFLHGLW